MQNLKKDTNGSAIVWAISTIAILLVLITGLLSMSERYHTRALTTLSKSQATYTAKSAVDFVISDLTSLPSDKILSSNLIPDKSSGELTKTISDFFDAANNNDNDLGYCNVTLTWQKADESDTDYTILAVSADGLKGSTTENVSANLTLTSASGGNAGGGNPGDLTHRARVYMNVTSGISSNTTMNLSNCDFYLKKSSNFNNTLRINVPGCNVYTYFGDTPLYGSFMVTMDNTNLSMPYINMVNQDRLTLNVLSPSTIATKTDLNNNGFIIQGRENLSTVAFKKQPDFPDIQHSSDKDILPNSDSCGIPKTDIPYDNSGTDKVLKDKIENLKEGKYNYVYSTNSDNVDLNFKLAPGASSSTVYVTFKRSKDITIRHVDSGITVYIMADTQNGCTHINTPDYFKGGIAISNQLEVEQTLHLDGYIYIHSQNVSFTFAKDSVITSDDPTPSKSSTWSLDEYYKN